MDLYAAHRSKPFSESLFREPGSIYRGTPFWSWNNKLDTPQLLRQLRHFKQMGMGGVHIHCRTGLDTPYMGKEFLAIVKACHDEAKRLGLLTWLYDEDRWPSGSAGGQVTRDPQHRAKHLLFTPRPYANASDAGGINNSMAEAKRAENGTLLAKYAVTLHPDGSLQHYQRLPLEDVAMLPDHATVWYAYAETARPVSWYNHSTYVDTLSKPAIEKFIELTHDKYHKTLGHAFGKSVPAIFTDEPQFARKVLLSDPFELRDLVLPFTPDLPDTFRQAHGLDLLDHLPEIVWALPNQEPSRARHAFHDHVAERFASAFADTLGQWCRGHGIALTGHMMSEPWLHTQTESLGEAMRSYRAFDIPGIDMLCDGIELTTAKQTQSAAKQYGRPAIVSELYGVTGWHFDFAGHKRQGDWQAAMGVTVRVPHLAWVSMKGEAKRDYPAAISYQSPWYREYKAIEDHFARLNTVLTRGQAVTRVAVIHPIESYWLAYVAGDAAMRERDRLSEAFWNLTEWLLHGGFDFDFVSESLLPSQTPTQQGPQFRVGQMAYDVVVVPELKTIRASTLERLEAFADAGGTIIFAGRVPTHVDVAPSDRPAQLAARSQHAQCVRAEILSVLEPFRELRIRPGNLSWMQQAGVRDCFLHQIRQDGDTRYVFVCNTDRDRARTEARIELKGEWKVTLLDTLTGDREPLAANYRPGLTLLDWHCPAHGHVLLELKPGQRKTGKATLTRPPEKEVARLEGPVPVTLSEPNVLLLDQAEWRLNDGAWQPLEEILRLHNQARVAVGLPAREGHIAQPYAERSAAPKLATLQMRFRIECDVPVKAPKLALEDAATTKITLDGKPVRSKPQGYFTDESIETVALPDLSAGTHELLLTVPLTRKRNVEWCYLLGDFGVKVCGRRARIIAPVRTLEFGDFTAQGLPFYAGNVTYHCTLPALRGALTVEAADFAGPTLTAALDGKSVGSLALAPHRVTLRSRGKGKLDLTLFGNRANAFGLLHSTDKHLLWYGPDAWRSTGDKWSYEYQLQPMGLRSAPRLLQQT